PDPRSPARPVASRAPGTASARRRAPAEARIPGPSRQRNGRSLLLQGRSMRPAEHLTPPGDPLDDPGDRHVEHGGEEQTEDRHAEHPGEYRDPHRLPDFE